MNENTERMLRLSHFTPETAADGIFWADAEGRIQHVNEATCRMHGYSRDELLAMRAHDISPHLSEEAWKAFWARVKSDKAIVLEGLHRTMVSFGGPGRSYSERSLLDVVTRARRKLLPLEIFFERS